MSEFSKQEITEINFVAARAFGHDPDSMRDDTASHVRDADHIQLHKNGNELVAVAMYKRYELAGKRALELAGRIVLPEYQGQGIGSLLLARALAESQPEVVVTYTRNPNVLKMMQRAGLGAIYPCVADDEHQELALQAPHASMGKDVVIHEGRYGEDGLYGVGYSGMEMSDQFTDLQDPGNALVVVGGIR